MKAGFKKIIYFLIFILLVGFFPANIFAVNNNLHISTLSVSDPGTVKQWYLDKIKASDAWDNYNGGRGVVVAVIDTGIDSDHPDLKNNIWVNTKEVPDNGFDDDGNGYVDDVNGWNFIDNNNKLEPDIIGPYAYMAVQHGTAIAGIIAAEANNAFAGVGIAWQAKIMPLKAFSSDGDGDSFYVAKALRYAIDNGADIINMSFVGFSGETIGLSSAVKEAYDKGILIVAAAGNNNQLPAGENLNNVKTYPVCYRNDAGEKIVLGVAALDKDDKKASFSNYGSACIDISAPGANIYSSFYQDSNNTEFSSYFGGGFNGSSVSVPQVVAAAALIKSKYSHFTNKDLMKILISSADNIDNVNPNYAGELGGRLNILRALSENIVEKESEEALNVKYVLSAMEGDEPKIWYLNGKGDIVKEFYAYAPGFMGGVNIAIGDIDNDGRVEVIAGAGKGGGPHVRIFNLKGEVENQFFAFDSNHRNGVVVALGDTDGDGKKEIIATEAGNSIPVIKVFDEKGNVLKDSIVVYNYKVLNSISLALGDVNKDGKDEIVVGPAIGQNDKIRVFDINGDVIGEFYAFGSTFKGGTEVAVGDLNNDGWFEIITSRKSGGNSLIQTYTYFGRLLSPGFLAYNNYYGGVGVKTGDRDGDKNFEIITAPRDGRSFEVMVIDDNFNKLASFYPFGITLKKRANAYIVTR